MTKQDTTTKLATTEASLKRWQTRLKRAATKVHQLDKQRLRLALSLLKAVAEVKVAEAIVAKAKMPPPEEVNVPAPEVIATVAKTDGSGFKRAMAAAQTAASADIPAFLNRADPHVAARMTAARKKSEAEERTKMPLTGRAALAKIKEKK